jgi:5-formyltetrahydrofolate cyclo-ligase
MALEHELSLENFWRYFFSRKRSVFLPRCAPGKRLLWAKISSFEELKRQKFGIWEPDRKKVAFCNLPPGTLVLVPGLAWSLRGERLGHGAGYYDRYLSGHRGRAILSVGLGFSCQQARALPQKSLDIRVRRLLLGGRWLNLEN